MGFAPANLVTPTCDKRQIIITFYCHQVITFTGSGSESFVSQRVVRWKKILLPWPPVVISSQLFEWLSTKSAEEPKYERVPYFVHLL